MSLSITGEDEDALNLLKLEFGGHRWQRVPPTEKRGRVQTSTVTVSVLDDGGRVTLPDNWQCDVEETHYSGSGAGGQHRNKHDNCVRLIHGPTGVVVTSESKSLASNQKRAWAEMERRLVEDIASEARSADDATRRSQMGSGMRGDKRRTYRVKDGRVVDHNTGIKAPLRRVLRGELEILT